MRNVISKIAAAAVVLMGVATSADAFVILSMKDLSTATTKSCNTFTLVGCGGGSGFTVINPDFVNFSGAVGVWTVAATQGLNNVPGDPSQATSDTTSLTVQHAAAGVRDLVVDFISFGFTMPVGELKYMSGSGSTTAGATAFNPVTDKINTVFSVDSDNGTSFIAGPTITTINCLMSAATNASCPAPGTLFMDPVGGVAGFSTRTQQLFELDAGSRINTTSSLTITVPEPMSVSLVGAALLGLGLASRRRRVSAAA